MRTRFRSGYQFDAGFAAFWWSHIPEGPITKFLDQFHAAVAALGARIVFGDNRFVPGSSIAVGAATTAILIKCVVSTTGRRMKC